MQIPHKWPGRKKLMVLCAAMRVLDTIPTKTWNMSACSANLLKKCYPAIRYNMRVVIELHQHKRGKDNG